MPWWLWLALGFVLLAIEAGATREFTLFCIGVSAILVGLMTGFGIYKPPIQWAVFGILSLTTVYWVRDWLRHIMTHAAADDREFTNIISQTAFPTEDIRPYGFGKAELRGTTWTAHNASSTTIPHGHRCKVMQVKGLTLWIFPE